MESSPPPSRLSSSIAATACVVFVMLWLGSLHTHVSSLAWHRVELKPKQSREHVQLGCRFALPTAVAGAGSLQVLENGEPLPTRVGSGTEVSVKGHGRYSVSKKNLWLSSTDGSDPMTNGRTYVVRSAWQVPSFLPLALRLIVVLCAGLLITSGVNGGRWREIRQRGDIGSLLLLGAVVVLTPPVHGMEWMNVLSRLLIGLAAFVALMVLVRGTAFHMPGWMERMSKRRPDPVVLGAFRVLFGLVTMTIAWRTLQWFEMMYFAITFPPVKMLVHAAVVLWLLVGAGICIGVGGRWLRGLNLVLGLVLMRNYPTFGIFESTYLLNSWLALVTRCDERLCLLPGPSESSTTRTWMDSLLPVYLVGLHFGFVFLFLGLDKWLCPLWFHGNGFYSFASLPWVLPPEFDFLSGQRWLMSICNVGGIGAEVAFLPLWVFRRTRPLAVLTAGSLVLWLVWPFRVFLIGACAVTFTVGLASVFRTHDLEGEVTQPTPGRRLLWLMTPVMTVVMLTLGMVGRFCFPEKPMALEQLPAFTSPEALVVQPPTPMTTWKEGLLKDLKLADFTTDAWDATAVWVLANKSYSLFSKTHSLGMYVYRVVLTMDDGSKVEPVPYFTPAKERGAIQDGWFKLNLVQGLMYSIGDVARLLTYGRDDLTNRTRVERVGMMAVMNWAMQRLNDEEQKRVRRVSLLVAPCACATEFQGVIPQRSDDWAELFFHDTATGTWHYHEMVRRQPVQGRDPRLPDYLPFLFETKAAPVAH